MRFGIDALDAVLLVPIAAAALLVLLPGYVFSSRLNVIASLLTLAAAVMLLFVRPPAGPYLQIDDLNVVFIVLNTFVGFTTSVFSASYIAHELEIGRLTPGLPAVLSRHVPADDVRHEPRAGGQ